MRQLLLLSTTVVSLLWGSFLSGQDVKEKNRLLLPQARTVSLKLERAREAEKKEDWETACRLYDELLEMNRSPKDGNLVVSKDELIYEGLGVHCRARLLEFPEKGIRTYRKLFDVVLNKRLEEAIEAGDEEALLRLAYDHPLATPALKALNLLADRALERGRAVAASHHLKRLNRRLKSLRREGFDHPELAARTLLRLGVARYHSGEFAESESVLKKIAPGGVPFEHLAEPARQRIPRFRKRVNVEGKQSPLEDYLVVGGGNDHATYPEGKCDLDDWSPQTFSLAGRWRRRGGGYPLFRPLRPALKGDRLFVVDGTTVQAFDVGTLNKPAWSNTPWRQFDRQQNRNVIYAPTVDKSGRLFASFIRDVSNPEDYRGIPIKTEIPVRRLVAFDTENGKRLWDHGGPKVDDLTAKTSFPAPPIVEGDRLYVSGVLRSGYIQCYVFCYDAKTGEMLWNTFLCSGQVEQTMFGEHAIEPFCTQVALSDGIIYHCTSFGVMAALNAVDGEILWLSKYDQIEVEAAQGYQPKRRRIIWYNQPPAVRDGVVAVTPLDSERYYAFDPKTGKILHREVGHTHRFLVGTREGRLILAGGRRVSCIDVESRRHVWSVDRYRKDRMIPSDVIARGTIIGDEVVIPHRRGLTCIDFETGRVIRNIKMRGASGLVSATRDSILLSTDSRVRVYRKRKKESQEKTEEERGF